MESCYNCLEITNLTFSIIGTIVTMILAGVTLYLTIRDRKNSVSIQELKKQTKTLQHTFIEIIKPNFMVEEIIQISGSTIFSFKYRNVGGQCYSLKVNDISELKKKGYQINLLETQSLSAHSFYHGTIEADKTTFEQNKEYEIILSFLDFEGRNYHQHLIFQRDNLQHKNIFFRPPILIGHPEILEPVKSS